MASVGSFSVARCAKVVAALLCGASAFRRASRSASKQKETKYIFFERDRAGFNNIRLQLQSMVGIASVTGRTLVLPPPQHVDHMDRDYYELDFFDAAKLMATVDVSLSQKPDETVLKVETPLALVQVRELDQSKDWFFTNDPSRIQHFECLDMDKDDLKVASEAVLHGLVMDHHLEEMASSGLQRLNLTSSSFDCAHIREGDFKSFAPQYHMDNAQLSEKLRGMLSSRPLLLVSDEPPKLELGVEIKYATSAYDADVSGETRIAVDMIMCSRAKEFIGSPLSTFTNGILELRSRAVFEDGREKPAVRLYAGAALEEVKRGDKCWGKRTTFSALCKKGDTSCF